MQDRCYFGEGKFRIVDTDDRGCCGSIKRSSHEHASSRPKLCLTLVAKRNLSRTGAAELRDRAHLSLSVARHFSANKLRNFANLHFTHCKSVWWGLRYSLIRSAT